jgi:hypothetical protein
MTEAFRSKSEALDYIEGGTARSQFQNCGNLIVIDSLSMVGGRKYHPYCKAHSLGEAEIEYRTMRSYCPDGCRFFIENKQAEKQESRAKTKKAFSTALKHTGKTTAKVLAAPFVFFRSLPPLVQSLLIILLIIWKLPSAKNTIIEILKAIAGR